MHKQHGPAREGEAVDCLLAGDIGGYNTGALRAEVLATRFHLSPRLAEIVASIAWGTRHDA